MNDPLLTASKFAHLARLAGAAQSEFECAAVYAAAQALAEQFNAEAETFDAYALEKVESARWSICACVGYDIDNGLSKEQHISHALGAAQTLQDVLTRAR